MWKLYTLERLSDQFAFGGLCKPAVAPMACQISHTLYIRSHMSGLKKCELSNKAGLLKA